MTDEANTEPEELLIENATAVNIPPILRPLAERNLVPAPLLLEAVLGFTLTGAMVSVKCDRKELAPRRLSHFAPDMLTRLSQELGAVGLVEIEISESRLATRGFAFFLESETVNDFVTQPEEPPKPPEPQYPDGEMGAMMRMMQMQTEALVAPIMATLENFNRRLETVLVAQNQQAERGMAIADMMAETQVARARRMLEAETQTPEEAIEQHLGAVDRLMTTAAKAEKSMARYAPKGDGDGDTLERLATFIESPRVGAIGRGFLRMLGGNVGASVDVETVTPEATRSAVTLPALFTVPKETA